MPLDKSGSKASIGNNIKTEEAAGKPKDQAVAIALDTARRAGADVKPNPKHGGTAHHEEMRQNGMTPNPNHRGHGGGEHH